MKVNLKHFCVLRVDPESTWGDSGRWVPSFKEKESALSVLATLEQTWSNFLMIWLIEQVEEKMISKKHNINMKQSSTY